MLLTHFILVITILVSFRAYNDKSLFYSLAYSPYDIKHRGKWYKSITHAFVHADFLHLSFNMLSLYLFGEIMEPKMVAYFGSMGTFYFFLLYFGGILFSTLIPYMRHQDNEAYVSIGASGAVSAVIFAGIIFMPNMRLAPFLFPFPMPGFIFGFLYITAELIMDKRGKSNIAHDAHLSGAIFGIIFISLLDIQILKDFIESIKTYFS